MNGFKPTDSNINGFLYVDGTTFTTVQQAITAVCAVGGGTVYVPPGTYPQNSSFTLCSNLYLIGAGRSTCDQTAAPTTITTTITSGDLFPVIGVMDHVHISGMCIKNIGTGGGVPLHVVGGRFGLYQDLYFAGPWANGIVVSPNVGVVSAIWNTFRNIHHTGYQTGAAMVVLDALNTTSQVLNGNIFEFMTGNGGATGFGLKLKATGGTCPGSAVFINENSFKESQFSTTLGGGTGISADNCTFRDLFIDTATIEGNNLSVSIGASNAGFTCLACEINSNTTNIPSDSSGTSGRTFISGNIGTTVQNFSVDAAGNGRFYGICIGGPVQSNCPNNISGPVGMIIETGSAGNLTFSFTQTTLGQQLNVNGQTFTNGGGTQTWPSATGTIAEFNSPQTWSGNQTNMALVTPTIGGGSTLNLYKTATDSPGAITVNAQTCTDRSVAIAGLTTGAVIIPTANYALEANLGLSPGQAVTGSAHYRICNGTAGNITLNAAATFNLAILQ
jgi:hypothetical protein